jgi:hypothetical protein
MAFTWQYYDLVLLGIFASMTLGVVVGLVTALSLSLAVTGAGFVAAVLIGHGLFVNGPVDAPSDLTNEVESFDQLAEDVEVL